MANLAEYEIRLKNEQFNAGLKSTEQKMDSFEGSLKGIQSNVLAAFSVGALVSFGNEAIKTSAKLQSLRNSIIFASGSEQEGAQNLQFLKELTENFGLSLESTTEGFRTFSGALIGSKFEGEKARDIFKQISYGVTAMGLSADDAKGAFLAIGQMVSKGTVSAEELRGQLGERLPGAFQIAARSMGVTTQALGKMLQAGSVITEDFLPKFADEMEKTFKGGLANAAKSQQADLSRLENKWLNFKDTMGNVIAPIIHLIATEEKSLTQQFQDQKLKVEGLTGNTDKLSKRYFELIYKTSKTRDETEELKDITNELAQAIPGAVTQWDNLGNAIGLSSSKMSQYITKNKEALKIINAGAIKEKEEELSALVREAMFSKGILEGKAFSDPNNLSEGQQQLMRDAASHLKGLTGSGGLIDMKRAEINDLKGGGRDSDLKEGVKNMNKMFEGLRPGAEDSSATGKSAKTAKGTSGSSANGNIGVEKIQAGTRNVVVNIQKLIEKVTFEKGYKESEAKLQEMITRALLTSVNDVNIVAQ